MAEKAKSKRASHGANGNADNTELREALERSEAEVERLRGLLVDQEAELGKARGRVEELEDRINRMLGAAVRLRRFGPALDRLRRLRRPRA